MAFSASQNGTAIANCSDIRAVRLKSIKADILQNLGDELTVTAIALRQGITPRYVHMLFETEGATFSEYVLGQRLMLAYGVISNPRFADLKITTVAFASGFADLSYFNRTFRRRFGTTPSELRKKSFEDGTRSRVGVHPPKRRAEMQKETGITVNTMVQQFDENRAFAIETKSNQ
jgi:AraC-like DNA-binding protein